MKNESSTDWTLVIAIVAIVIMGIACMVLMK